jgi:integrase
MTSNGTQKRRPIKRATITKRRVDGLHPGESLVDDQVRGFVARCLKSGSISYGLRFSVGGKQKWFSLGLHGRLTPTQARELAQRRAGEVAAGHDPVLEREQEKRTAITQTTLGDLVPIYLDERKDAFRASVKIRQKRYLERYWQPLHKLSIGDITRKDVVAVVKHIEKKHGPVAADRARSSLSAFYNWAIEEDYCTDTPVRNIKDRNTNGARTRKLSEDELVEVWKACLDDDYGRIVRLLILTGQRKSEIGDLGWREINTAKRQIDLPPDRTKNGNEHIVPLSDEALAILKSVQRSGERDFVFEHGAGGFSGWSKAKKKLDQRIAAARKKAGVKQPMDAFVIHDIRRSVVTLLVESRKRADGSTYRFALPHVVEMLVNHVSGHKAGIAGVYNAAEYLPERRQALDMWGNHIAALVAGRDSNVIPLARTTERA